MAIVISGMITALLGVIFYFRWRAAHPLPEPESVRSVVGDSGPVPPEDRDEPGDSGENWERPDDWWRSEEDRT